MADPSQRRRGDDDLLEWFTISYRTIVGVAGVVVLLLGAAGYFYFFAGHATPGTTAASAPPQAAAARFTSIEGSVRVKAVGTFEWVSADTGTSLRRGDLVRTNAGAAAEITFADGTTVQMRPDSLLTIEETARIRPRGSGAWRWACRRATCRTTGPRPAARRRCRRPR